MSYLFAAYLSIWILIFGYVLYLGRKEKQLQEELFLIRKSLDNLKNS